MAGAHQFVGRRRREKAERGTNPGIRWHDNAADTKLFRNPAGVQGCGTAEGDQRAFADGNAALDGVHTRGIRHVFIDDFADAYRGLLARSAGELAADAGEQSGLGATSIDFYLAAGETRRIDLADGEIGIGDRRLATPAPVTG